MSSSTAPAFPHPRWLFIGLGIFLLALVMVGALRQPPRALPASALENQFSAERARQVLVRLLGEQAPHPVGAPDHERMRQQVIAEFAALGISMEEQKALSCDDSAPAELQCAVVRNLIARLPGQSEGAALMLAAHYDSATAGPGAADDGANVAALVEVARAWQTLGPARSPVVILITDGEELNLLGARAFMKHPLSREVGAVINLEARGTRGQSILFEAGPDNAWLIDAYAQAVRYPVASSLAYELYQMLPNDTDLTVFKDAGLPGLNFAFAANANAYHTPLDNLDNLSLASLQHQGENVLAAGRALAAQNLDSAPPTGDAVYMDLFGLWLVKWPAILTAPLALLALAILAAAAIRLARRGELRPAALAWGALAGVSTILLATLLGWALAALISLMAANPAPWYAYSLSTRLAVWGAALFSGLLAAGFFARRAGAWGIGLGTWAAWALAGLILGLTLPGMAAAFIIPALGAALLAGLAVVSGRIGQVARRGLPVRELAFLLAAWLAGAVWLGLALTFEELVGYELAVAIALALGVQFSALLPLFAQPAESGGMRRSMALASALLVVVSAVIAAFFTPPFSEENPQPLNLVYTEKLSEGQAYISPRPGLGGLPPSLAAKRDFQWQAIYPWSARQRLTAGAPPSGLPAPEFEVLAEEREGNERVVSVALHSPRAARELQLYVPSGNLVEVVVGDTAYPIDASQTSDDFYYMAFLGLGEDAIVVRLRFKGPDPVTAYLGDISGGLPASESDLIPARGVMAMPVDFGDITYLFKKIEL